MVRRLLTMAKWATLILVIAVTVALIAGGTLMGSEWGRLWLTHMIVDKLNQSTPLHISINNLSTPQLGHWKAASIRVRQDQQLWIVIDEFNLKWQPKALFDHRIIIEQIRANSFSLHKLASNNQADKKTSPIANNLSLKIPAIQLKNLSIPSLNLYGFRPANDDKNRLGYAINANANWLKNAPLQINIEAQGLDAIAATINLQVQSDDWVHTKLAGSLREDAGGFFGKLLQLPKQQAIQASFDVAVTKLIDRYSINLHSLRFPLAQRNLSAQGHIAVSTEENNVYVDDLALSIDDTHHSVIGSWIDQQLDFEISANRFPLDIAKLWQDAVTRGELSAQLKLNGTTAQPHARGSITLNTVYKQLPIVINFVGSLSKSRVNIDSLQAQLASSDIQAQGKVDIAGNTADLKISANNVDLNALEVFDIPLPDKLEAIITTAKATLHGPIKNPQGELLFTAKGHYQKQPFSVQSRLTKDQTTLFIRQATLSVADGNVSLQGSLQPQTLDANITLNAESLSIRPESISPESINQLKLAGINLPATLDAKINTQLNLSGNLRKPTIAGNAQLQGVYQTIPFVLNVSGHHQNSDSQLEELNLLAFNEQVFTASGHYQAGQFDIRAQAQKLPTQLFSAFGWYVQPGKFNADIHARGSLKAPTLNGHLSYETVFSGYDADGDEKDINFIWDLNINTSIDAINFASTFTRDNHQPGRLLLKIPTQPYIHYAFKKNAFKQKRSPEFQDLPLQASLAGKFNLQTASFLLDPDLHRLTGDLNTDIDISGTLAKPSLKGTLHIDKTRYENPITGTLVDNIDCLLTAEQISLSINSCQATDGYKGQYALAGTIRLPVDNDSGSVALKLQTQGANILRRPDIDSKASGEITLSGDFTSLLATGNLEVAPFTAIFDANFSSGIPSIDVEEVHSQQESEAQNSEKTPTRPNLRFDLVITASQQAYLRGHGLEAELQGQIDIHGDIKKPLYEGEFKTVRGVFELFNKKFNLEQGQVNFANNAIGLAITGIYKKNGQRIQADISGTNDDIKINFSATPQIPEDEILAFIIFGKPIQTITPFEAVQLAAAVQTLRSGGGGFFDPIGKTRDILGIDTLSVESAATKDGGSGVNVGIGKYLNEKVYLELERTPNPSQPWKGNLEIELTPNINLESSTGGQTGIEGAELKWKRDY